MMLGKFFVEMIEEDAGRTRGVYKVRCPEHQELVEFIVTSDTLIFCPESPLKKLETIAAYMVHDLCPQCIAARKPVYESKWPEGAEL